MIDEGDIQNVQGRGSSRTGLKTPGVCHHNTARVIREQSDSSFCTGLAGITNDMIMCFVFILTPSVLLMLTKSDFIIVLIISSKPVILQVYQKTNKKYRNYLYLKSIGLC